jgi:hypothetical protein
MNLNPFTLRWSYRAALALARVRRSRFEARMGERAFWRVFPSERSLECSLASILGRSNLPEMLVCLSSFLAYAGTPELVLIVSDGSLTREDAEALRAISPRVRVVDFADHARGQIPGMLQPYLKPNNFIPEAYVKKLVFLLSLDSSTRWFFTDPDVLFFEGASSLKQDLARFGERPAFMQDIVFSGDARQLDPSERFPLVNTGVLYIPRPLDWSEALARLAERGMPPAFFAEQTAVHFAMRSSGGEALCPKRYVLSLEDQWLFKDQFAGRIGPVCRHYVSTVRHKFWLVERYPSKAGRRPDHVMELAGVVGGVGTSETGGAV